MAILTILGPIFGVIATFVKEVAMERFTNCIYFNNNMQTLKEKLEALTSKASDIEERVKREEVSGKKRRTKEVENWLENVEKFKIKVEKLQETKTCKCLLQGTHLKKLIEGAGELIKQIETFRELVVDAYETSRERLFTTQLHGETLKQELDNILAWVEANSDQVPIIGIYGMGGVGKTTLAKHIHKKICMNLQGTLHVYWVTVSQEADINKLQNDLAKKLNSDLPKDYDIEEKAVILHKLLRDMKNVVLILDDVWKYFDLEKIGVLLGMDGCKVIITSRLLDVCDQMGCKNNIINVQPRLEEEAWKLFLEKLDCVHELSPEVEEVAKKMAKKCSGLPLAIIIVARSMIGVDDIHEWSDALEELKDSIMGQNDLKSEVFPILQYSYNHLRDPRLQQCFLYCSLYPEDHEIPRDELISLFISEGLMNQRESRAAEFDQGQALLNRLVKNCLLESAGKEYVKMHDLVREMAVEITRNNPRFMIKAGALLYEVPNEQVWTEDLDKVSLMHNKIVEIPEDLSPSCLRLSTLILSNNLLKFISNSLFAHMDGLRVLNLRYNRNIETLPNSISELENLRALLLGSCNRLCHMPSLTKLTALMELDMSETGIKRVPEGMECLVKLKCLNMHKVEKLEEIPRGLLPRLARLQRLLLPLHIKVESKEVESLKLLEEFEGWVDNVDIFYSKWFNKSPPLTFYKIAVGNYSDSFEDYSDGNDERRIVLHGCSFKRGGGDVVTLPHNIRRLKFIKCKGLSSCLLENVPSLYNSKDFRFCRIEKCDEIESIIRISSASKDDDGPLQNLEYLELSFLENLIGLIKWEPRAFAALPPRGTFSSLKELGISDCDKMKKLFPHKLVVHNLRNLEKIIVVNCRQMDEIIADNEKDEGVDSTSNGSSIAFPKLIKIDLWGLPELDSICKGEFICCDSIERIYIGNCPKLKRLPFFHPSSDEKPPHPSAPSSSSSSSSSNNNNNNNNKYTNIIPFPKLIIIWLYDLPELDSIYEGVVNCCDSIQRIYISNCPKIKRLPFFNPSSVDEKLTFSFPKLEELDLWNLPEVKSVCNGIMICDSIKFIHITGCRQVSRLPLYLPLIDTQPSPPPSLRGITISETEKEWWESLEWDHPNSNNVLRPFLKYF